MPQSIKKKAAKKRPYKKRTFTTKELFQEITKDPEPIKPKKDNELAELTMICAMMDNFTHEQKQRVLKFLCGRYYDFL